MIVTLFDTSNKISILQKVENILTTVSKQKKFFFIMIFKIKATEK